MTRRRGPIDPRLVSQVAVTRRYLAGAVGVGVASTATVVVQAVLLASVVDRSLLHHAGIHQVLPQLAGLAGAVAARAALVGLGEVAAQRTSATVVSVLRRRLLDAALGLGPVWLTGERTGELSLAATRGVGALDGYFGRYLPQLVVAGLAPVGILAWVAANDWLSALVLLGMVALVPVAMIAFGRESAKRTRRQWRRLSSLAARFLELVQGLPTLRAFGRAEQGRREVAASTEALRVTTMGALRVAFLSALAMELLSGLGVGLVAMALGLRLLSGGVALATALAVLLVSPEVFLPLRRAGAEFHASTEGQAAAARILDVLERAPDPGGRGEAGDDRPGGMLRVAGSDGRADVRADVGADVRADVGADVAPDPARSPVELRGVSARYPGRDDVVVEGLDLTIVPGERVALVGTSGAGKSTVLALLLGFLAPEQGEILVGGVDLRGVAPAAWRRRLTWVPQRPHLFRGSLADNLRLGQPEASDAEVARAVDLVGLADFVGRLPQGLSTPVGEDGLGLSAGERQRVALGRAVLKDAPLVLLDEPVTHLDPGTVEDLGRSLQPWLAGRTVLVATHRPELVPVDRVVHLDPEASARGRHRREVGGRVEGRRAHDGIGVRP